MSSQSADGGAPLRASKPEPASFLRNETTISKLASIFYQFAFISSREREKRRERAGSFELCVALEGGSDGSPGESGVGFPGSHRGK